MVEADRSGVVMKVVIEGNHAASYGAKLCRVQVVAAYPITPQTQIVEELAELAAEGGLAARFLEVESEHSAMASCIGAAMAGARAFTAASSQGLALMHELLHWAAGARLPVVMVNVNRAMAPPWSIYADQTDSLAQRDTGWMQIYCSSNQEVLDSVIQAYRVSEVVGLPTMLCLDAFFLSHTSEPVEIPDQAAVDAFLPPYRPALRLDPAHPRAFGGLAGPEVYMEIRHDIHLAMEEAKRWIAKVGEEFGSTFGRPYGLVEGYRWEDAEILLATAGTLAGTAEIAVDGLRERGKAAGLLRIRALRPFPREELARMAASARKLLVLDRNVSLGAGGIFAQEVLAALFAPPRPEVYAAIAGLGGRDVTPEEVQEALCQVWSAGPWDGRPRWLGLRQ